MTRSHHLRLARWLIATIALFVASPAVTQERLAEGTWVGTVEAPGEGVFPLEYVVSYGDEGLEIVLIPPPEAGIAELPTQDVTHMDGVLSFSFNAGSSITCELHQDDEGGFEGECVEPGGEAALMRMTPPASTRR